MGNTGGTLVSFQTGSQNMNIYSSFTKGYGAGYVIAR